MRIAVLSRGIGLYSTQSIVEAGMGRGHEMWVMDYMQCNFILETNQLKLYYDEREITGLDAVIPRIGASFTTEGASVIRQFEGLGVYSLLSSQSLVKTRDKLHCLQILAAKGLPVPKTVLAGQSDNLGLVLKKIGGPPYIVKIPESTHGVGVMLLDSEQGVISVAETLEKLNQRVIIQEFIKEAEGADFRAIVVGGQVVASMKRQAKEGEFRSNLHRGAFSVPASLTAQEELLAKKATQILGLNVAGVDMLRSKNGPLILEINASPGLEGIETATRVDVAWSILLFLERALRKKR